MKTVIISNAAGTIAQSICRVLRASEFKTELNLIGMKGAAELVPDGVFDTLLTVPRRYNEVDGVDPEWLLESTRAAGAEMIIPTTDYESSGWSKIVFPTEVKVLVSPAPAASSFHDKWKTAQFCAQHSIHFVKSSLPSNYNGGFKKAIAKPRMGGLSRGLISDFEPTMRLPDSYVIQEWLRPPELTIAFYVTKSRTVLGPVALERELRFGITTACIVRDTFYAAARQMAELFCFRCGVIGPCNVQCRFDLEERLTPFEVNCRFSGTCGLRSDLGFSDISFAVAEYLFDKTLQDVRILSGGGVKRIREFASKGVTVWDELASLNG